MHEAIVKDGAQGRWSSWSSWSSCGGGSFVGAPVHLAVSIGMEMPLIFFLCWKRSKSPWPRCRQAGCADRLGTSWPYLSYANLSVNEIFTDRSCRSEILSISRFPGKLNLGLYNTERTLIVTLAVILMSHRPRNREPCSSQELGFRGHVRKLVRERADWAKGFFAW